VFHVSILGGLGVLFGGLSPPKPPVATGLLRGVAVYQPTYFFTSKALEAFYAFTGMIASQRYLTFSVWRVGCKTVQNQVTAKWWLCNNMCGSKTFEKREGTVLVLSNSRHSVVILVFKFFSESCLALVCLLCWRCRQGARRNFLMGGLKFWEKYFAVTKVQATLFTITFMSYTLFQF